MNARLQLATVTTLPFAVPATPPATPSATGQDVSERRCLLPDSLTLAALVDPSDQREIEITDEMVRAAIDSIEDELVTPYRDGRAPAASVPRRADVIPFPVHRARRLSV